MNSLIPTNNSPIAKYVVVITHTFCNGESQINKFGEDTIADVRKRLVFNAKMCERGNMKVEDCVSSFYTIANVPAAMVKTNCERWTKSMLAYKATYGGITQTATVEMQR